VQIPPLITPKWQDVSDHSLARNPLASLNFDMAPSMTAPIKEYLATRGEAVNPEASRSDDLLPWQLAFAEWLAYQDGKKQVSRADQLQKANDCKAAAAGVDLLPPSEFVTAPALRRLKARASFKYYFEALHTTALKRARAMFEQHMPKMVRDHLDALQLAVNNEDHKAIAQYTNSALDRLWPKREAAVTATAVTITLSPKQHAALDGGDIEVMEAELLDDEDDAF